MRRHITALAILAIAALVAVTSATARTDADRGAGRYIVVLKPGANARAVANEHAAAHAAAISFVYSHALRGYAATIPNARLAAVQADERVAYVEPDGEMSAVAQTLPWGIDRIEADVSSTRAGDGSGAVANVNVYVIDTGVDATHPDLNVVGHVAFAGGPNRDCHGHGTHVAGTIAARDDANDVVGVAPGAPITGVKVLGCNGSGSNSGVIAGIDWVTANAIKPAVANMSLGGGASQAIDDAVRRSAASGVFYALAAGNEGDQRVHALARTCRGRARTTGS